MGWIFAARRKGRGLATEAGRGALDWSEQDLGAAGHPGDHRRRE